MENSRGFHHRAQVNFEKGGSGQGAMMPEAKGRAGMKEPTNHGGHTHEMARRAEHDARVAGHRAVHTGRGGGQQDHERILHDTHRLHQGDGHYSHGNKFGESSHYREEAGEGHSREPAKFLAEEAAERRRGEE
jgi:hypothetical protein